jgi:hypothetical protein
MLIIETYLATFNHISQNSIHKGQSQIGQSSETGNIGYISIHHECVRACALSM